jgi:hypothetical protein
MSMERKQEILYKSGIVYLERREENGKKKKK